MSIVGLILAFLILAIVLLLTYPLACWASGANEVIDKCEELKKWAESELRERKETDA